MTEDPSVPVLPSMEDFSLDQSRDDTLHSAFDQVIKNYRQMVCPDSAKAFPHFVLIRDRLYLVSCDTHTREEHTQLLVLKSRQEVVFQVTHYNLMLARLKRLWRKTMT